MDNDKFIIGCGKLHEYYNNLTKIDYGVLMYCEKGEAHMTINLNEYHVVQKANIFLLPNSIISIDNCSDDFSVSYFKYSTEMMHIACFRLEPAFFHFINDNPFFITSEKDNIGPFYQLIKTASIIYLDRENRFRNDIAQNLLEIFIWDTYDKVQRYFTKEQLSGNSRKEELFKKFIDLLHNNAPLQRDVTWYADTLCISTRYLATIVKEITKVRSAKDIIDRFSVLELKVALQKTNLSIKEIADKYNFPDQSFLGRYFKKHTGYSPSEYRQLK